MCVGKQQFIPFLARMEEKNWANPVCLALCCPGKEDEAEMPIPCYRGVFSIYLRLYSCCTVPSNKGTEFYLKSVCT